MIAGKAHGLVGYGRSGGAWQGLACRKVGVGEVAGWVHPCALPEARSSGAFSCEGDTVLTAGFDCAVGGDKVQNTSDLLISVKRLSLLCFGGNLVFLKLPSFP